MIIDASALVAVLSDRDHWHQIAASIFRGARKPFITCEAVITECCFLLNPIRRQETFGLIEDGAIRVDFSLDDEMTKIARLMSKYDSVPMSLADACLVRMSETFAAPIFTFDADFLIYRRHRREHIPLVGIDE